jgi:predicted ribosomally synthesized peptide with SipW-like signal peptide
MKTIIKSMALVIGVAAIAGYATYSFYSDTEESKNNTFTAGKLDLLFQKVDGANKTEISGQPLFDLGDLKPGDMGEKTVRLAVDDNPACGSINVNITEDKENTCTEPESIDEANCNPNGEGELNDNLNFFVWRELDCDNKYETGETLLTTGALTGSKTYNIGELPTTHNADICYGIAYCFGSFNQETGTCNGTSVNNVSQSDSFKGDITIAATQKRNQYPEGCPGGQVLFLENEDRATNPWTPIINDNKFGVLSWQGDGNEFKYNFQAVGLSPTENYKLIYAPDPWPQSLGSLNLKIADFTTDASGNIAAISGTKNLGYDIPSSGDANFAIGGKIWLVLAADHDDFKMTAWNPDKYLFEGNVFIHYNDTNSPS